MFIALNTNGLSPHHSVYVECAKRHTARHPMWNGGPANVTSSAALCSYHMGVNGIYMQPIVG